MWEENIDIEIPNVGVEVALEEQGQPAYGVAIEISQLDGTGDLYFGVMSHENNVCRDRGFLEVMNGDADWANPSFSENESWCAFRKANSARDLVLSLDGGSGGRMSNGRDIVEDITEHWFSPERIKRLKNV